ncbi:hypothetical protein C8Q70DRAFT_1108332 [Cubamyces menziesii]|nr:hypothetical protein C8Q70DRAFT_1108332 [Cubamyces menziesii]
MSTSSSLMPQGFSRPNIPALDNTYGAMMLGTFIGLILYGVNVHQNYRYVRSKEFKTDSTYVKAMVAIVFTLETLHSVIAMHSVYYYVVRNYFNPLVLFHGSWSINFLALLTGILFPVCQSFFARRLWLINYRFRPLVAFIAILLVAQAGFTVAITVEAFIQPDLAHYENYSWMISAELGIVLIADVLMTALLIITLRGCRTGFRSTEQILNTVITYAICTGLLTDTLTIISFFLAVVYPHTLLADGLNVAICHLYANTLLAVLNSRYFLHNQGKEGVSTGPSWSNVFKTTVFQSRGDKPMSNQNTGGLQETLEIRIASDAMHGVDSANGADHPDSYELDHFPSRGLKPSRYHDAPV